MSSINEEWIKLLANVQNHGFFSSPRGKPCLELFAYKAVVSMSQPVITVKERKLGYRFMAGEAWWILDGRTEVDEISPYCKTISNFSDDGLFFFGAYGPMIKLQLSYILRALVTDMDTRQAVLTIWRQSPMVSKDIPCTVSLQWMVRDSKLHCFANMRSSDSWLGVPYDWFNFSAISAYLLLCLKKISVNFEPITLGSLVWNATSQHLYSEDLEKANKLVNKPTGTFHCAQLNLEEFYEPASFIRHLKACSTDLAQYQEHSSKFGSKWLAETYTR